MKTENHLDIKEMERLKICTHNLELMQKHIDRLEGYALRVDDVLGLESASPMWKLEAIARMTESVKEFI